MELNYIQPITILITTLIPFAYQQLRKLLPEPSTKRKATDYEFLVRTMASDLSKKQNIVVEHAFHQITKKQLNYSEVIRLVNLENPTKAIELFIKARGMVSYNRLTQYFEYIEKYDTPKKRWRYKLLAFIKYYSLAMLLVLCLLVAPKIALGDDLLAIGFSFLFIVLLVPTCALIVNESSAKEDAEKFMKFLEDDPKYVRYSESQETRIKARQQAIPTTQMDHQSS